MTAWLIDTFRILGSWISTEWQCLCVDVAIFRRIRAEMKASEQELLREVKKPVLRMLTVVR